jgi:hypothetical protein
MINFKTMAAFAVLLVAGIAVLYSIGGAAPARETLVVYNGFAYYEGELDAREMDVQSMDIALSVPPGTDFDSVRLSLQSGNVIGMNFVPATRATPQSLIKTYVGKEVYAYDSQGKEMHGTLVKYDEYSGVAYIQAQGGLIVISPSYTMLAGFSGTVPETTNDSVVFKVSKAGKGKVSYLMDSMSWAPAYTLDFTGNGNGELSLFGSVENGAWEYKNVTLSLVFGNVNRIRNYYYRTNYLFDSKALEVAAPSSMGSGSATISEIGQYYKFDLGNVDIQNGSSKYLLSGSDVSGIREVYRFDLSSTTSGDAFGSTQYLLRLNNSKANGLGKAMPSGTVQVIGNGGFLGEASISDTPVGETAELAIGSAFDVIGRSWLMNQKYNDPVYCKNAVPDTRNYAASVCAEHVNDYLLVSSQTYHAVFRNKKNTSVVVSAEYYNYGDWVVTNQTVSGSRINANRMTWEVTVPAGGESTLDFSVAQRSVNNPYYASSGGSAAYEVPQKY